MLNLNQTFQSHPVIIMDAKVFGWFSKRYQTMQNKRLQSISMDLMGLENRS